MRQRRVLPLIALAYLASCDEFDQSGPCPDGWRHLPIPQKFDENSCCPSRPQAPHEDISIHCFQMPHALRFDYHPNLYPWYISANSDVVVEETAENYQRGKGAIVVPRGCGFALKTKPSAIAASEEVRLVWDMALPKSVDAVNRCPNAMANADDGNRTWKMNVFTFTLESEPKGGGRITSVTEEGIKRGSGEYQTRPPIGEGLIFRIGTPYHCRLDDIEENPSDEDVKSALADPDYLLQDLRLCYKPVSMDAIAEVHAR